MSFLGDAATQGWGHRAPRFLLSEAVGLCLVTELCRAVFRVSFPLPGLQKPGGYKQLYKAFSEAFHACLEFMILEGSDVDLFIFSFLQVLEEAQL